MGLFKNFVSQTRKPTGFLGKVMLNGMNSGHGKMADWGMSYLNINNPKYIADLGCGGGRNAAELIKRYSKAKVWAVDYSPLSVQKATEYNKEAIARLLAGKTVLVIAHRMRTVAAADKIAVLADGKVAEQGSPGELVNKNGIYAHMAMLQNESGKWSIA